MTDDASGWDAVYAKAKDRGFGTSEADVKDYGAAAGSAGATAACVAYGAAAAAPICAEVGGIVGRAVTGAVLSIGESLFGSSDVRTPADTWNPVIDKCITEIVRGVREHKKLDVKNPPGGSFRNYPEFHPIAVRWAQNANAVITEHAGTIVWFDGSAASPKPGHILSSAVDMWWKCRNANPPMTPEPPKYCRTSRNESPSKYIPEAIVRSTQRTMIEALNPPHPWAWFFAALALGGLGAVVWWSRRK